LVRIEPRGSRRPDYGNTKGRGGDHMIVIRGYVAVPMRLPLGTGTGLTDY